MFPHPTLKLETLSPKAEDCVLKPYVCQQPECNKSYKTKTHLNRHVNNVHFPNSYKVIFSCPKCFKTFTNRQNLKRHLSTVHEKEYICEVCQKQFKKKSQLGAHMYEHTGVKEFRCEFCSETFQTLYLRSRHLRFHKTHKCTQCREEFNLWSEYKKHRKAVHQKSEFICDECGKVFHSRTHIIQHLKTHTEQHLTKTFPCPYQNCERSYSKNSNLKQHIMVKHLNIFHTCVLCNAQLSTKAKLDYHLGLHFKVRPPKAKVAGKERKPRKDKDTIKTITALKLSGLSKASGALDSREDSSRSMSPLDLTMKCEVVEDDCKEDSSTFFMGQASYDLE